MYAREGLNIISIAQASGEIIELPSLEELFRKGDTVTAIAYQSRETVFEVLRTSFSAEKARKGDKELLQDQTAIMNRLGGAGLQPLFQLAKLNLVT